MPQVSVTEITQTYLTDVGETIRRVRKRGTEKDGYKYTYTEKTPCGFGECIENERETDVSEYENLLMYTDNSRKPIKKRRFCFWFEGKMFELDVYDFEKKYATLEIELSDINENFNMPEFIDVIKDVTGDFHYSNAYLAAKRQIIL